MERRSRPLSLAPPQPPLGLTCGYASRFVSSGRVAPTLQGLRSRGSACLPEAGAAGEPRAFKRRLRTLKAAAPAKARVQSFAISDGQDAPLDRLRQLHHRKRRAVGDAVARSDPEWIGKSRRFRWTFRRSIPLRQGGLSPQTPGMAFLSGLSSAARTPATTTQIRPSNAKNTECGHRVQ